MQAQVLASQAGFQLTTDAFTAQYLFCQQIVRKRLSRRSSYFGIKPLRLPNGRLLWPADSIKALIEESKQ